MKKLGIGILIGIILATSVPSLAEAVDVAFNKINVVINNKAVSPDNVLINGKTYVPLRTISEGLGMNVTWDEKTSTANISKATPTPAPIVQSNLIVTGDGFNIKFLKRENHNMYYTYLIELINTSDKDVNYDMKNNLGCNAGSSVLIIYAHKQAGLDAYPYKLLTAGTLKSNETIQGYVSYMMSIDRMVGTPEFRYKNVTPIKVSLQEPKY